MTDDKQTGYEYLQQATDEQLTRWREDRQDRVRDLEREVKRLNGEISLHTAELDRRAIDAYWQAHPEQTRVNVGDRLQITQDMVQEYGGSMDNVGRIMTVKQLTIRQDGLLNIDLGTIARPTLDFVIQARRAYLVAHPESEADR